MADLNKCQLCGIPFTYPSGQFSWNCKGCGMVSRRQLTKGEFKNSAACPTCRGEATLPEIGVRPTAADPDGEPVISWGAIPCPSCDMGRAIAAKWGEKRWPTTDYLTMYFQCQRDNPGEAYCDFIYAKYNEMIKARIKERKPPSWLKKIHKGNLRLELDKLMNEPTKESEPWIPPE